MDRFNNELGGLVEMAKRKPTTTATVETLTAEVQVLKVNNRQITLSVAKQLDYVPLQRIEPFGRVKIGNQWCRMRQVPMRTVIGRHSDTNALVLSNAYPEGTRKDGNGYITETGLVINQYAWPEEWDSEMIDLHRKAKQLPLIVLAGLR